MNITELFEQQIVGDSLSSYHKYYIDKKVSFAKWTKRETPIWFTRGLLANDLNVEMEIEEYADIYVSQ